MLVGTNLFTHATTRYITTRRVLTSARDRLEIALKTEGLYEQVFPSNRPRSIPITSAISQAGGMYYWWNDGLAYWGDGGILALVGSLVPFVQLPRNRAVKY